MKGKEMRGKISQQFIPGIGNDILLVIILLIVATIVAAVLLIKGDNKEEGVEKEEDTAEETYLLNFLIARANEGDKDAENWLYAHGYEPIED